jgi:TrmH family RNA methyltransferase
MDLPAIGGSHPCVRQALALRRGATADRDRLLLVEGLWAHQVLLATNTLVHAFLHCAEASFSSDARGCAAQMVQRAQASYSISARTLARLAERDRPDGLLSVVELPTWSPAELPLSAEALVAVADGLETPGNIGTLLRTLDGCAGEALLVTNQRARLTHPAVFRASHGTSLLSPSWCSLPSPTRSTGSAGTVSTSTWRMRRPSVATRAGLRGRTAVVLGAERYGISATWYDHGFASVQSPCSVAVTRSRRRLGVGAALRGARPQERLVGAQPVSTAKNHTPAATSPPRARSGPMPPPHVRSSGWTPSALVAAAEPVPARSGRHPAEAEYQAQHGNHEEPDESEQDAEPERSAWHTYRAQPPTRQQDASNLGGGDSSSGERQDDPTEGGLLLGSTR